MKNLKINIFFFIFAFNSSFAFDMPAACLKQVNIDCVSCTGELSKKASGFSNNVSKYFAQYAFVDERMSKLERANTTLKKSLVPIFRSLRDGEKEPSYKEMIPEIKAIRQDFDRLTILSRESVRLERRIDKCLFNCSAYSKLQLLDELEAIQKLKLVLFMKRPILADKVFEEKMLKLPAKMINSDEVLFSEAEFRNNLLDATFNTLQAIGKRETQFSSYKTETSSPKMSGNVVISPKFADYLVNKYPNIVEDIVRSAALEANGKKDVDLVTTCSLAEKLQNYYSKENKKEMALSAATIVIPLLAGPVGVELGIAGRALLTWGISSGAIRASIGVASMMAQVGLIGKNISDLQDLSKRCSSKEIIFISSSSEETFNEYKKCHKDYSEKVFLTELGVIATGVTGLSNVTLKLLGNLPTKVTTSIGKQVTDSKEIIGYIKAKGLTELKSGQVSLEFKTPTNGVYSVLDLSKINQTNNQAIKELPEQYWRYVGNLYNERLNLSQLEIENFIKSSVELSPRTKLILNTDVSPLGGTLKIKGGIGLVNSKNASELLPLEKATGIKIDRKPNEKIVEIVRLAVAKNNENLDTADNLVDQVTSLIKQDETISRIFIFTSKIHARLYKKMGVIGKFSDIDKRDVLIEINRKELDHFINNRSSNGEVIGSSKMPAWNSSSNKNWNSHSVFITF
jgi:hypothetical protein